MFSMFKVEQMFMLKLSYLSDCLISSRVLFSLKEVKFPK